MVKTLLLKGKGVLHLAQNYFIFPLYPLQQATITAQKKLIKLIVKLTFNFLYCIHITVTDITKCWEYQRGVLY